MIVRTDAGHFVEIQVRTELQQQWAEMSEKVSDLLGLEVKYGGGPSAVRRNLDFVSLEAWRLDQIMAAPSGAIVERTGVFTIMENASPEQVVLLDAARTAFVTTLESALDDLSTAILNAVEGLSQQ